MRRRSPAKKGKGKGGWHAASPFPFHLSRLKLLSGGFGFDNGIVSACVVVEVALVDAKEEDAVARGDELSARAYEDEFVVVVADDGDESARRVITHQLVAVGESSDSGWRREAPSA